MTANIGELSKGTLVRLTMRAVVADGSCWQLQTVGAVPTGTVLVDQSDLANGFAEIVAHGPRPVKQLDLIRHESWSEPRRFVALVGQQVWAVDETGNGDNADAYGWGGPDAPWFHADGAPIEWDQ